MNSARKLLEENNNQLSGIREALLSLVSTQYTTQTTLERLSGAISNGFSLAAGGVSTVATEIDGLVMCLEKMSTAVASSVDNMMKPEMLSAMRDELIRLEIENAKNNATLREVQQELILLEQDNTRLRTLMSERPTGAGDVPATCG